MKPSVDFLLERLMGLYGYPGWFSMDGDFETLVGVILMQGSLLKDVSRAIDNMRREDLLDPRKLILSPYEVVERCIKSTRFYKSKVKKLKEFAEFLQRFQFSITKMRKYMENLGVESMRKILVNMRGVGPETADMILLHVFKVPIIPRDRGLVRLLERIYGEGFDRLKDEIEGSHKESVDLLSRFVLLLLEYSRMVCKNRPKCSICVLSDVCKSAPGGI